MNDESLRRARVLVFGNEKGGTGKSTLAMHFAISLLDLGREVVVIDLDARQRSLSRYIENRHAFSESRNLSLPTPKGFVLESSDLNELDKRDLVDTKNLQMLVAQLQPLCDDIVIDCPGSFTTLSRVAHELADTLLTPMNDSFIDLDLFGQVDPATYLVNRVSHYSEMVWDARKRRGLQGKPPMDWIVTRNRVSSLQAKNKERIHDALHQLQKRFAFRYLPAGVSERVVYRELFPLGLTLLDYPRVPELGQMSLSHVAARQELRQLVNDLRLPFFNSPPARPIQSPLTEETA